MEIQCGGGGGVFCMWLVCANIRIVSGTVLYNVHYNIYVVSQCTNVHEFQYLEERIFTLTAHTFSV